MVDPLPPPSRARAIAKALRPHQWSKNLLVFVAPALAHRLEEDLPSVLWAFASISLVASAGYVINDLVDVEHDRRHPTKRQRPFASGELGRGHGLAIVAVCLAAGLVVSHAFLSPVFSVAVIGYLGASVVYSLFLKSKLIVDVLVIAALFTLRVFLGGIAAGVEVSFWLLAFSVFFFTGLAFSKRYAELLESEEAEVPGRAYRRSDLEIIRVVGPASGFIAVFVLALYIDSAKVRTLYATPPALWPICLVLIYWVTRLWFLATRGALTRGPMLFAIRDRVSYGCAVAVVGCALAARVSW